MSQTHSRAVTGLAKIGFISTRFPSCICVTLHLIISRVLPSSRLVLIFVIACVLCVSFVQGIPATEPVDL